MKMAKKKSSNKNAAAEFGVNEASGSVIFTAASIVRAIGTLLLLVVLARLLHPTGYGLYAIAIALASLLGLSTDYGVGNALRKKLPEAKTNERKVSIMNNAYFGVLVIGIVIALIGVAFSNFIAIDLYHNAVLTEPIMIAFVSIIFSALFAATISALLGMRKSKEAGIGYIVYSISQLILALILITLGYGVAGALASLLFSLIIAFVVSFSLLIKYVKYSFTIPSIKVLTELFGFSTPIFASNAFSNGTNNLGVVLLGIFVSSILVGNYGAAFKLASFGEVIIIAGTGVLLPVYSHMISNKKLSSKTELMYNSSIYYSLLFLLPLLVYLISVSKPFIYIFLGAGYTFAPLYFPIIAIGIITGIIYRYGSQLVIGHGKIKIYTIYIISISAIIIVLLLILTPLLKVYGVLLSLFIIGPVLFDLAFLKFMSKELNIKFYTRKPLRMLIAAIIVGLVLIYVAVSLHQDKVSVLVNIVITLLLYPPILALLKGIDSEDMKFISKVSDKLQINFIMKYFLNYVNFFIK